MSLKMVFIIIRQHKTTSDKKTLGSLCPLLLQSIRRPRFYRRPIARRYVVKVIQCKTETQKHQQWRNDNTHTREQVVTSVRKRQRGWITTAHNSFFFQDSLFITLGVQGSW